jgi:hypothetical protein
MQNVARVVVGEDVSVRRRVEMNVVPVVDSPSASAAVALYSAHKTHAFGIVRAKGDDQPAGSRAASGEDERTDGRALAHDDFGPGGKGHPVADAFGDHGHAILEVQ